jgi:predicted nucleic acid-binding protein
MIVVSDASPLLALAQADSLYLLEVLFGRVLIPGAVYRETVEQCPVPAQRQRIQSAVDDFISVSTTESAYRFSRNLGSGEQGVLALALERGADLLLMDDKKARNEAHDLGFPCAYTTDVLRLAEERRIIVSAAEIVERLHGARIHLPFGSRN